jgi:hypothetical protein
MVTSAQQIVNKPFYFAHGRSDGFYKPPMVTSIDAMATRAWAGHRTACDSAEVDRILTAAEPVPWTEIPAVRILGAILGVLLIVAAIRAMFGRR